MVSPAALCLGTIQARGDADLPLEDVELLREVLQEVESALPGLRVKGTIDGEAEAVRRGAALRVTRVQAGMLGVNLLHAFQKFEKAHQGAVSAAVGLLTAVAVATDLSMAVVAQGGTNLAEPLKTAVERAWDAVLRLRGPSAPLTAAIDAIIAAGQARGPARALSFERDLEPANKAWHEAVERLLYSKALDCVRNGGSYFSHAF